LRLLGDSAREDVRLAAGGKRQQQADRLLREGLRGNAAGKCQQRQS